MLCRNRVRLEDHSLSNALNHFRRQFSSNSTSNFYEFALAFIAREPFYIKVLAAISVNCNPLHIFMRQDIAATQGLYSLSSKTPEDLAPVPLAVLWSNSKFDQKLSCSGVKYNQPITTKFCTRHDNVTFVTYAKFHCDRWRKFQTRTLQILTEFRIRSKYR